MELICSYLNEFLAPRYGENIYITFKDPTPEDTAAKNIEMQAVMGSQPVLSVNEAREKFQGLGPVEGGDDVMVASNLVPVGTPPPAKPVAPPAKSMQKGVKSMQKRHIRTRAAQNFKARNSMRESAADLLVKKLKEVAEIKKKSWATMTKDEYYYVWKDFTSRMEAKEPEVKKILQGINAKQKKEVMAGVKDRFKGWRVKAADPFSLKEWIQITINGLTPLLSDIYEKEGEIAGAGVGKPGIDLLTDINAKNALDEAINLLSSTYKFFD